MKMHTVEIDDKLWNYLKKFAEPFEDTPNSVLHRLIFERKPDKHEEIPDPVTAISIKGVPKALSQIFEVLYEMMVNGYPRTQATKRVAKRRGTTPQTVIDKYCRQLNKKAHEIDSILEEPGLYEFKNLLKNKFVKHHEIIDVYFGTLDQENMDETEKAVNSDNIFNDSLDL